MGDPRQQLGMAAEEAVASWLEGYGWRIMARRYRSPTGGEVDLIALDPGDVLVAIEVRARRTERTGTGSESIDRNRTARIGRTLASFGCKTDAPHRGLRVDLVTVSPMPGPADRWRVRRIPNIGAW